MPTRRVRVRTAVDYSSASRMSSWFQRMAPRTRRAEWCRSNLVPRRQRAVTEGRGTTRRPTGATAVPGISTSPHRERRLKRFEGIEERSRRSSADIGSTPLPMISGGPRGARRSRSSVLSRSRPTRRTPHATWRRCFLGWPTTLRRRLRPPSPRGPEDVVSRERSAVPRDAEWSHRGERGRERHGAGGLAHGHLERRWGDSAGARAHFSSQLRTVFDGGRRDAARAGFGRRRSSKSRRSPFRLETSRPLRQVAAMMRCSGGYIEACAVRAGQGVTTWDD